MYRIETLHRIFTVRASFNNQAVTSVYFESKECRVVKKEPAYSLVEVDGYRNYLVYALPNTIPAITLRDLSSINRWGRETTEALTSRSEEHTSELQSRGHLVCRLLLEKKK